MLVPGRVELRPAARGRLSLYCAVGTLAFSGFFISPVPGCAAIIGAAGAGVSPDTLQEPQPGFRNRIVFLLTLVTFISTLPLRVDLRCGDISQIAGKYWGKSPPEEQEVSNYP